MTRVLAAPPLRRGRGSHLRRSRALGLVLVGPSFLVIALLVLVPSVRSVFGSLQHYDLLSTDRGFVGLGNYARVLADASFRTSIGNTAGYFVVISIGSLLLGLVAALWLQSLRGATRAIALTVVMLPWAVPGTVAGILWSFILDPTGTGLLNAVLTGVGLIPADLAWVNLPVVGTIMIGATVVWGAAPLAVVILLAGLEGIPEELSEAAVVDGAGPIRRFLSITLPLLRPAIAIVLVNAVVLAVGLFDQVYVLVGLAPDHLTVAGSMYLYAFRDFNFGFGFAAAVFATAITGLISAAYLRFVYREEEY